MHLEYYHYSITLQTGADQGGASEGPGPRTPPNYLIISTRLYRFCLYKLWRKVPQNCVIIIRGWYFVVKQWIHVICSPAIRILRPPRIPKTIDWPIQPALHPRHGYPIWRIKLDSSWKRSKVGGFAFSILKKRFEKNGGMVWDGLVNGEKILDASSTKQENCKKKFILLFLWLEKVEKY